MVFIKIEVILNKAQVDFIMISILVLKSLLNYISPLDYKSCLYDNN